ncbi:hypothetical protein FSP39_005140 [Pinctada imbricata]|uniref:Uncharacterized protein n=1 Tax=Pinctada imbricata TaxID=66713 RepID=A0AA89C8F2_PINIB|nr:hypothetical protein FSP39_005140 [Pinctada imbricata]
MFLTGGTADITVHARTDNGKLKEVYPASGGSWGGKDVEENFLEFFQDIVGKKVFDIFKKDEMEDYMDLMRDFENLKRSFVRTSTNVSLRIPVALNDIIEVHTNYTSFRQLLGASKNVSKDITFEKGKLIFPSQKFEAFFHPVVQGILQHLENLFRNEKVKNVDKILMVGGFSDCKLVQDSMREAFRNKTVITPNEAGLIVLKGAVYFGHLTEPISVRVSRYTYGIQSWPEFDPAVHPKNKMTVVNGVKRCRDVFFKFVTRGEEVTPGHRMSQTFQVLKPDEDTLECIVYASDEEDPKFVDSPDCRTVMKLSIPLQALSLNSRMNMEIEESLIFGETELKCYAKEYNTGKDFEVKSFFGSH